MGFKLQSEKCSSTKFFRDTIRAHRQEVRIAQRRRRLEKYFSPRGKSICRLSPSFAPYYSRIKFSKILYAYDILSQTHS